MVKLQLQSNQKRKLSRRTLMISFLASVAGTVSVSAVASSVVSFSKLKAEYPRNERAQFYQSLGGEWPTLVDNPNYRNTCSVRMSMALNGAGAPIPSSEREAVAGDGRNIILRVRTMYEYLSKVLGNQSWGLSKNPGQSVELPVRTGIVLYHADFADATGHVDLWTGTEFVGQLDTWQGIELPSNPDMSDINDAAFEIGMWFLD